MAVGIDYEDVHDRLWVAGGDNHTVRVYDASSGDLLETYTFIPGSSTTSSPQKTPSTRPIRTSSS